MDTPFHSGHRWTGSTPSTANCVDDDNDNDESSLLPFALPSLTTTKAKTTTVPTTVPTTATAADPTRAFSQAAATVTSLERVRGSRSLHLSYESQSTATSSSNHSSIYHPPPSLLSASSSGWSSSCSLTSRGVGVGSGSTTRGSMSTTASLTASASAYPAAVSSTSATTTTLATAETAEAGSSRMEVPGVHQDVRHLNISNTSYAVTSDSAPMATSTTQSSASSSSRLLLSQHSSEYLDTAASMISPSLAFSQLAGSTTHSVTRAEHPSVWSRTEATPSVSMSQQEIQQQHHAPIQSIRLDPSVSFSQLLSQADNQFQFEPPPSPLTTTASRPAYGQPPLQAQAEEPALPRVLHTFLSAPYPDATMQSSQSDARQSQWLPSLPEEGSVASNSVSSSYFHLPNHPASEISRQPQSVVYHRPATAAQTPPPRAFLLSDSFLLSQSQRTILEAVENSSSNNAGDRDAGRFSKPTGSVTASSSSSLYHSKLHRERRMAQLAGATVTLLSSTNNEDTNNTNGNDQGRFYGQHRHRRQDHLQSHQFQVSIDVAASPSCTVRDVMDIVGDPDLLRLWCDPVRASVITASSEGARTTQQQRQQHRQRQQRMNRHQQRQEESSAAVARSASTASPDEYDNNNNNLHDDEPRPPEREYEGEWMEATTTAPLVHPTSSAAGCWYHTRQAVATILGFPSYGKIVMFVERQRGHVSLSIGQFAGGIEVLHKIQVSEIYVEGGGGGTSSGCLLDPGIGGRRNIGSVGSPHQMVPQQQQQVATKKIRIVDHVRLSRASCSSSRSGHDYYDDSSTATVSCCGIWHILEQCFLPSMDDYMDQVLSSMARLRFLIENGDVSSGNLMYEPPPPSSTSSSFLSSQRPFPTSSTTTTTTSPPWSSCSSAVRMMQPTMLHYPNEDLSTTVPLLHG